MTRVFLVGLLSLVVAACGKSPPASLCENQVPAPAGCDTPCDSSPGAAVSCGAGFFCNASNKCDIQCTAVGSECKDSRVCTADGRCVDGEQPIPPDAKDCPAVHFTAARTTPTVELLLDQSGTMDEAYGGGLTRWEAMRQALVDDNNGVVKKLQGSVVFGASLYSGRTRPGPGGQPPGGIGTASCPDLVSRPRVLNNFNAIRDLLQADPIENTPTPNSIDEVIENFAANPPAAGSPPIILLATDGLPDTCADANPQTGANSAARQEAANQASVQAAQRAYAAGIKLFFLFIGDEQAGNHPQQMANVGIGRQAVNPPEGNADVYLATNPDALATAFNQIVGSVVSCELTLSGQVDLETGKFGHVTLNDMNLIYDLDWTLGADGKTITLKGTACETLKTSSNPRVDATFACGAVIL